MNKINVLDCTLRDGGYINNFYFGEKIIVDIIDKLSKASIDIIECGFLKSNSFDKDRTLFGNIDYIKRFIKEKNKKIIYVAMLQYGAISIEEISDFDGNSIDGIRLTFHEEEIEGALILGKQLIDKGYKVFMQPVGTMTYTDKSLLILVEKINKLNPFSFYIVDTLGNMYKKDLLRTFYLIDNNLNKNIVIGLHSHNNLQLSFSNAQELIQINTPRKLIIDSSVYGMGRGAGNLNTELITNYINTNIGFYYNNIELLEIIDEYIKPIKIEYKWGYDIAYCIAAITNCHPNYASFLLNKQTLHAKDINIILNNLDIDDKKIFDSELINKKYLEYMDIKVNDDEIVNKIYDNIKNKTILLVAPGKSLNENIEKINKLIELKKYYVISINFIPTNIKVDSIFVSNMKRFKDISSLIDQSNEKNIMITSNILNDNKNYSNVLILNYSSYLNEENCISDNAGLMCINLLNKLGIKSVSLVGFDGFSNDSIGNYYEKSMNFSLEEYRFIEMNVAISKKINSLKNSIDFNFITDSVYDN